MGIWGEAGIGKSFEVQELLRTLPYRSLSVHSTTPLSTLVSSLPQPKKLALWAAHNVSRLVKGEAVVTASVLDSIGALLTGLAPFVLHLEDIHEADQERLELIQDLAKIVLKIKGVALVVTSRKEAPLPFTALKLEPLTQIASKALLEAELKTNLPSESLSWIYGKAAGNPLYTLEYLRHLNRQGFLWSDGKTWHWREPPQELMPATVEALIEQLIYSASTDLLHTYILETRALLPLTTDMELWAKIARITAFDLTKGIRELSEIGIFNGNDFAHPLFRELCLKNMPKQRRQNLARRAVNALSEKPLEAAYFVDDAKLEPAKALALLRKAAHETPNKAKAGKLLAQALYYCEGEEKSRLALEAASWLAYYDQEESIRLTTMIEKEHLEDEMQVYSYANLLSLSKKKDKVEFLFATMPETERKQARYLANYILARQRLGNIYGVLELWESYPEKSLAGSTVIRSVADSLANMGKPKEALKLLLETLKRDNLSPGEQSSLWFACGNSYFRASNYTMAEINFAKALLIERASPQKASTSVLFFYALTLIKLGRLSDAIPHLNEACVLATNRGLRQFVADINGLLGEVYTELGDYPKAESLLLEARATLNAEADDPFECLACLSDLYRDWGSAHSGLLALKYSHMALNCAKDVKTHQGPRVYIEGLYYVCLAETKFGDAKRALEFALEATNLAKDYKEPRQTYQAAFALGLAYRANGKINEARSELEKAERLAAKVGATIHCNKIGLELDHLNNDLESARSRMHWFTEGGLLNGVNIAKRYFSQLANSQKAAPAPENMLRLEVLGSVQIANPKMTLVRGRKRQELLAQLLEARISGRSELSRLTLLDTLYPDEDELKASSSLKNLVHGLRDMLGENAILTTATGYALGTCSSDVEQFLQTGDTRLWRDAYLKDLNLSEESHVRDSVYDLLYTRATTLLESDVVESARVSAFLLEEDPYSSAYLKIYLSALRFNKQHSKLARHYQKAKQSLLEVGETLPETWQAFLA